MHSPHFCPMQTQDLLHLYGAVLVRRSCQVLLSDLAAQSAVTVAVSMSCEVLLFHAGHRVLLFSQMTRALDLIGEALQALRLPFLRLDGSTKTGQRAAMLKACCHRRCDTHDIFDSHPADAAGHLRLSGPQMLPWRAR